MVPAQHSQILPRCPNIFPSSKLSSRDRKDHLSEGPSPVGAMFLSECSPLPSPTSTGLPTLGNLEVGNSRELSPSFCVPSPGLTFHTDWGSQSPSLIGREGESPYFQRSVRSGTASGTASTRFNCAAELLMSHKGLLSGLASEFSWLRFFKAGLLRTKLTSIVL